MEHFAKFLYFIDMVTLYSVRISNAGSMLGPHMALDSLVTYLQI